MQEYKNCINYFENYFLEKNKYLVCLMKLVVARE